uniref:Uncharacterized protein n=1 Tax=viral metagenome TaxID=1070528 RepID=A0A6M3J2U1_9ZZZZ
MKAVKVQFKSCDNCHKVVKSNVRKCPECGKREFTDIYLEEKE